MQDEHSSTPYLSFEFLHLSPLGLTPDGDFFMNDFEHAVFG